jgi:AraC family transcriptional regulator of adaptative response / DNA-3-methyladenine glycosylase II
MSLADVAFAAGFASVRRFNALFQERFGRPPSALRRDHGSGEAADFITLRLDYRPPLDWEALLGFLRVRAIPGIETVDRSEYRRSAVLGDRIGWLSVTADAKHSALRARVSLSLAPKLMGIVTRLRALFDLDARPDIIANHLQRDSALSAFVTAHPGLRVPGAFDGFETAVRGVLGQQVSVRAATTLSGRFVHRFGKPLSLGDKGVDHVFPTADSMASASVAEVRTVGIPEARARTIIELARAVAEGRIDLENGVGPEQAIGELESIPGIGPWTAHYLAMRVLRWPNAFPAGDLAVRKALGVSTARAALQRAEAWQPWRAYAVMHLWNSLSHVLGAERALPVAP